ncbi:tRNA 2-thiouridine(34) synthase MnmA [Acetobacteraceae bacterium]|nr:tRNA 2-thiouridine(34) synthase MnmA [Candidatus Parcubacteria bacterium]
MTNISPIKPHTSGANAAQKAFVGLSGGVDSAVSAALLLKGGYDVTGVFIKIQIPGYPCPAALDRIEAMRVAAHLRIPFIEIDLSKEYEQEVFRPSIAEFKKGRTPNPDTLCNEKIKFGLFFNFARLKGADVVATGHYAQLKEGNLYTGTDPAKDQSYFLWMVPQAALAHTLFPVGSFKKTEVRKLAEKFDLPNRTRKDSQGLCFLGDISIEDMLEREVSPRAGEVLYEEGEVIGNHKGAALYTLGQRHGLQLLAHTPVTKPHFVIAKDIERNTLIVSQSPFPKGKHKTIATLSHTNWIGEVKDGACEAQYRYHGERIKAELLRTNDRTVVTLDTPHYVPLGQSLVLYRGEKLIGGGILESATLD